MALTSFEFSDLGVEITMAEDEIYANAELWLEHPKTGYVKKMLSEVDEAKSRWLIPFVYLQKNGTYHFRYICKEAKIDRILGGRFASSITHNDQRMVAEHAFERMEKLYRANLYVPFTRKSVRLKVDLATAPPFSLEGFDYLKLGSVKRKKGAFVLRGTAIVSGRRSDELEPFLDFKNSNGELVYSVAGERLPRPTMQKRYGSELDEYLMSGFKFQIPLSLIDKVKEFHAPSRLPFSVRLKDQGGNEYSKPLKASPEDVHAATRTLCKVQRWMTGEAASIISAEANNQIAFRNMKVPRSASLEIRFKEWLTFRLYSLFKKPTNNTWLLFEFESQSAQDNGVILFRHLLKTRPDITARFIIDRKSHDFEKISDLKQYLIYKYSLRHYWNLLTAKVLISSQSRFHSYKLSPPKNGRFTRVLMSKPFVFLQHGVLGLKKIGFHRRNYKVAADLFFSSTNYERDLICNEFGYAQNEVPLVGLPRFDLLKDLSSQQNEFLIMPTWRKSLQNVNEEAFKRSQFFQKYMALLRNPDLVEYCESNNITIKFYLHALIAQHIKLFEGLPSVVKIVFPGQENVNEMLMKAKLLITDYSSVAWDFLYMKKPVLFYHFDIDEYNRDHGSYFDLKQELGELSISEPDIMVSKITDILNGVTPVLPDINTFDNYDSNNSQRAVEAIEQFLADREAAKSQRVKPAKG